MDPRKEFVSPVVVAAGEDLVGSIIAAALADAGYAVVRAEDGAQVPALVARHAPRVVLVDINTARRTGLEVLRALRQAPRRRTYGVLVLSVQTRAELEGEARQAGADDFLVRPFAPAELVYRVDRLYSLAMAA